MLLEYHILGEEGGYWVDLIYQAQEASLPLPPVHSFLGLINTCVNRNAPPGIPLTDFSITGLFDLTPYVFYILFLYSLNPASCIPGPCKRCSWPWFCFDKTPPCRRAAHQGGRRTNRSIVGENRRDGWKPGENRTVNSRGAYPSTFSEPPRKPLVLSPYHIVYHSVPHVRLFLQLFRHAQSNPYKWYFVRKPALKT